jgi:hypothetical protein
MSSLRTIDLRTVDDLVAFVRGPGFVLDFSDASYSEFFATELGVDIDDPTYSDLGGSKGKRLRRFMQKVDDSVALEALKALWEYRAQLLLRSGHDPVQNAEALYLTLVSRLGGNPATAQKRPDGPKPAVDRVRTKTLGDELIAVSEKPPQARGYAFESFLNSLFDVYGMKPREAFRNRGEQIDGSFVLANETYLLEAKWQAARIGSADLHSFHGKLDEKAPWARGLFISHSGFTEDGLIAFGRAKRLVCMDGLDLYEILERGLSFDDVLDRKVRRAAETGLPFISIRELF